MNPKPWFTSKINLQAVLNMIAGLALYLAGDKYIVENAPTLIPIFVFVNGVVLMVVRTFFTKAEVARSLTGSVPLAQEERIKQEINTQ